MRASIWLAALAVGLALAGRGSAQTNGAFAGSSAGSAGRSGLSKATGSSFSLTGLFQRFRASISTQQSSGYSNIPDPSTNSTNYLKAFGYQRLH